MKSISALSQSPSFLKQTLCVLLIYPLLMMTAACNFSNALDDLGQDFAKVTPFLNLIPAFVCPVDESVCPTVTNAEQIAVAAGIGVSKLFTDWSTASAAAQPGLLAQLIATEQTFQKDQSALIVDAQVKNVNAQTEISGIATALETATGDALTLLQDAQMSGGTTAALANVLKEATPVDSYSGPLLATAIMNPLGLFKSADTFKLKSGRIVHSYHYHRQQVLNVLKENNLDPQVAKVAAEKLKVVKSL
jgi:hypothetical protein